MIIEKEVKKFGKGAHIIVPHNLIGRKVKIIVEDNNGSTTGEEAVPEEPQE